MSEPLDEVEPDDADVDITGGALPWFPEDETFIADETVEDDDE